MSAIGRHRGALAVLAFALIGAAANGASAHDPFEVTTDAHASGGELGVHTTMSLSTAGRECLTTADFERRLEPTDFEPLRERFEDCARNQYQITSGGEALPVLAATVALGPEGDLEMRAVYPRPTRSPLSFHAQLLERLPSRAGVVLTVTGPSTFLGQKLLRPDDAVLSLPITEEAEAPGTPPLPSLRRYLRLGLEHILTGADHLLFLLGLLASCRRPRAVAILVSCFTVAHSASLALGALGWVTLSPHSVEPLIAASIVVVGIDNLRCGSQPDERWLRRGLLTFAFGLIHGLGFATALRELGLGIRGTSVVGPLLAFNAGVELGQLSVAALVLALLWYLPRRGHLADLPRLASLGITATGMIWLVERLTS